MNYYKLNPIYWYNAIADEFYSRFKNPLNIKPYGVAPVRAEGFLKSGESYAFYARGCDWSLKISKTQEGLMKDQIDWSCCKYNYCEWPLAGLISNRTAIKLATFAIREYQKETDSESFGFGSM
jgi:hypothetical protein